MGECKIVGMTDANHIEHVSEEVAHASNGLCTCGRPNGRCECFDPWP